MISTNATLVSNPMTPAAKNQATPSIDCTTTYNESVASTVDTAKPRYSARVGSSPERYCSPGMEVAAKTPKMETMSPKARTTSGKRIHST